MREIRTYGSEVGAAQSNAPSLPLSLDPSGEGWGLVREWLRGGVGSWTKGTQAEPLPNGGVARYYRHGRGLTRRGQL